MGFISIKDLYYTHQLSGSAMTRTGLLETKRVLARHSKYEVLTGPMW